VYDLQRVRVPFTAGLLFDLARSLRELRMARETTQGQAITQERKHEITRRRSRAKELREKNQQSKGKR